MGIHHNVTARPPAARHANLSYPDLKRGDDPVRPELEKLGVFYLGREYQGGSSAEAPPLLYEARDLTTHAVCLGMTGSGKTGLCLALLEEAALDGIPAIAIDPKGDLGNLLLTFPALQPSDFRPWVDEQEASRRGLTPDALAAEVAERWRTGLLEWEQDGARIQRLRDAADMIIYTPGSDAGVGISMLRSLAAPPAHRLDSQDALRERVTATVSGLLGLLGLDTDPVRSRDHVLVSSILDAAWRRGEDLDLTSLIQAIQTPPFAKIGVLDLETVYPSRERASLAMSFNNLIASPSFGAWMEGDPLDIPSLLWTREGRPRLAVVSIAHLSEAERMFFVTLLLNEVVAWMRGLSGSPSLRALVYMDEVLGFLPPTANPPSKLPLLTLLKQARAYGLGVVLASQNPVDLDYKALANAGTWFLGRLQTERDKARVLEGLEGASSASGATFDRSQIEATLAGLKSRVFLMNNVHEDQPVLFESRWAMSYLRGPLTRAQIRMLTKPPDAATPASGGGVAPAASPSPAPEGATQAAAVADRPVVPPEAAERFVPVATPAVPNARLEYRPALVGSADLHFVDSKLSLDHWAERTCLAWLRPETGRDVWAECETRSDLPRRLGTEPDPGATFAELPAAAARARSYATWERSFKTALYRDATLTLWQCPDLDQVSRPGEGQAELRVRLREAAREHRDLELARLKERYAPKLKRMQDRLERAQERLAREKSQYSSQKVHTAISLGATVLGALFGRKARSMGTVGRVATTVRGASRASREKEDVERAEESVEQLEQELAALEKEFQRELDKTRKQLEDAEPELVERPVRPRKADIQVKGVGLVWVPFWIGDGILQDASRSLGA